MKKQKTTKEKHHLKTPPKQQGEVCLPHAEECICGTRLRKPYSVVVTKNLNTTKKEKTTMKNSFFIPSFPPSVNHCYTNRIIGRRVIRFPTQKFKTFKSVCRAAAINQKKLSGPVRLNLTYYTPDKRRRDLDNMLKATFDGLNDVLYLDDSQVVYVKATKEYCKERPGVLVEVLT